MSERLFEERWAKVGKLRALGVEPYGGRYDGARRVAEVREAYSPLLEGLRTRLAGRLMAMRRHGKSTFADLRDLSGRIQLYFQQDRLGESGYQVVDALDVGDLVGVAGRLGTTRTGELTVFVDDLTFLAKALRPLPEKWHGLKDVELRSRQRYLDLIANPEVRERFVQRTQIVAAVLIMSSNMRMVRPATSPMMLQASTSESLMRLLSMMAKSAPSLRAKSPSTLALPTSGETRVRGPRFWSRK